MENIFLNNFMGATTNIDENKKKHHIKYLVTSHKSYYKIALPVLLQSMVEQIPVKDILVVIGGMDTNEWFKYQGMDINYVTYNNWDHTGFSFLAENWDKYKTQSDYWFNLHDTCQCGPFFSELVYDFPSGIDTYAVWSSSASNLGLYKSTWFEQKIPLVLKHKQEFETIGKQGALLFEDTLWTHPKSNKKPAYNNMYSITQPGMGDKLIQVGGNPVGYKQVYEQDTKGRRAICYRKLNLYKFKSDSSKGAAQGF